MILASYMSVALLAVVVKFVQTFLRLEILSHISIDQVANIPCNGMPKIYTHEVMIDDKIELNLVVFQVTLAIEVCQKLILQIMDAG